MSGVCCCEVADPSFIESKLQAADDHCTLSGYSLPDVRGTANNLTLAHFFHPDFSDDIILMGMAAMIAGERTVLIVEDNIDFHMLTKLALNKCGYKVESLFDGTMKDVLMKLMSCDIVLLDVDLPTTSGTEISNGIKSNPATHHIPIIMITGNAEGPSLCNKAHADACLIKPFPFASLLETIEHFFGKATQA